MPLDPVAELLVVRVPSDPAGGFADAMPRVETALALGVGGVVLEGGTADAVRELVRALRRRTKVPLLIGADAEAGAGQVFRDATGLPPMAALEALDDLDAVRRAARLAAREVRAMGVNWLLAPVCDLALIRDNPLLGTRAPGDDPVRASALVSEWVDACQREGVLACAKHFPGQGRTSQDPHLVRPVIDASAEALQAVDVAPFRAAVEAGIASVMVGNVAYPALDASGAPAACSAVIIGELLREVLGFDALVASDVLAMPAAVADEAEGHVAVRAVAAGCDLLVGPQEPAAVAAALRAAVDDGRIARDAIERAVRRRRKWAQWATPPSDFLRPAASDVAWGAQLADRALQVVHGDGTTVRGPLDVLVVQDDGEAPTDAAPFYAALRLAGLAAREVPRPVPGSRGTVVVALFGETRPGKGRVGHHQASRDAVAAIVREARDQGRTAVVGLFAHPRHAAALDVPAAVVAAWSGAPAMQEAFARWLASHRAAGPTAR